MSQEKQNKTKIKNPSSHSAGKGLQTSKGKEVNAQNDGFRYDYNDNSTM